MSNDHGKEQCTIHMTDIGQYWTQYWSMQITNIAQYFKKPYFNIGCPALSDNAPILNKISINADYQYCPALWPSFNIGRPSPNRHCPILNKVSINAYYQYCSILLKTLFWYWLFGTDRQYSILNKTLINTDYQYCPALWKTLF